MSKKNNDIKSKYINNSILIPDKEWKNLPLNSYISYIKNDDVFVKGGYIKIIYDKEDKDEINNTYMVLSNKLDKFSNDKYYKEFTVKLNNIKSIYKKINDSAFMEYQIIKNNISKFVQDMSDKYKTYDDVINSINSRLTKLEENNLKVIKLIKKLHNIDNIESYKNKI